MRKTWIAGAVVALVLAGAGFTLAQSQDNQSGMMGGGMMGQGGMMGPGMMGQGGQQGGMMGPGMMGQLSPEQLEQFAKQHGITVEQAKQMTELCHQMMSQAGQGASGTRQQ